MIASPSRGLNWTCTHLLAIVTNGLGTVSAMRMITVVSGGSSMVFNNAGAASVDEVEVDEDEHLAPGGPWRAQSQTRDVTRLIDRDRSADTFDHLEIGMPERERLLARRTLATAAGRAQQSSGKSNGRFPTARAGWTDEEIRVQRRAQRPAEKPHRCRLALHAVEDGGTGRALGSSHRAPSMPRRARTARSTSAATSKAGTEPSTTTQCSTSSAAILRKPSLTLLWNSGSSASIRSGLTPGSCACCAARRCSASSQGISKSTDRSGHLTAGREHRTRDGPPRGAVRDRSPGRRASIPRTDRRLRAVRRPVPALSEQSSAQRARRA